MSLELIKSFLLWCTVTNFAILLLWLCLYRFSGDWFYQQQTRWFPLERTEFAKLHYVMYGGYKLSVMVFFAIPYLVLSCIS